MTHPKFSRPFTTPSRCLVICQSQAEAARMLLRSRREETLRHDALLHDPYAETLLTLEERVVMEEVDWRSYQERMEDAVATRFVDDALLEATSITLPGHGDYHQIVLVTPGLDTRSFRQDWPRGTVLYDIASHDMHTLCRTRIETRVSPGSLHIPVAIEDFRQLSARLERSGFRGDRLSVWAIQGWHLMEMTESQLENLFVEISQLSKSKSLVVGELPCKDTASTVEFLAQFSLISTVSRLADVAMAYNRKMPHASHRCVFRGQQQLHSLKELDIYTAHVQAAEETDEDFLDNFSLIPLPIQGMPPLTIQLR